MWHSVIFVAPAGIIVYIMRKVNTPQWGAEPRYQSPVQYWIPRVCRRPIRPGIGNDSITHSAVWVGRLGPVFGRFSGGVNFEFRSGVLKKFALDTSWSGRKSNAVELLGVLVMIITKLSFIYLFTDVYVKTNTFYRAIGGVGYSVFLYSVSVFPAYISFLLFYVTRLVTSRLSFGSR